MRLRQECSGIGLFRVVLLLLIFTSIAVQSSAVSYTIYVKPSPRQASTAFNYVFNFTTDSACTNVLLSNKTTITTDSEGIGYVILNISSLTQDPRYLCEYRGGALRKVHSDLPTLLPASKFALNTTNQTLNNKINVINSTLKQRIDLINTTFIRSNATLTSQLIAIFASNLTSAAKINALVVNNVSANLAINALRASNATLYSRELADNATLTQKIIAINNSIVNRDNWINSTGDRVTGNFNYSNKGNITNVNKGVITNLWASFVGAINSIIHFLSDIELSGHKIYNASQINSTAFYQSGKAVLTTQDNSSIWTKITGLLTSNVTNTNKIAALITNNATANSAISALRTSNATLYARELADNTTQNTALNTKLNSSVNTANPIIKGNLNLTKNVTLDTINVMNRTGQIKSKIYYDEVDNRLIIQVTG
ncbi:hypothetical protein J4482_01435 [Candidatus Woesearchaeota archaeon]|nr:hypothetical protein [uncultured archaeon]MBS3115271.1 hypothetical protein [Candidatus Woesearchaeota archaeon]